MAAPIMRVLAFQPLGAPGLGKGIWAFSDCTHYLIRPCILTICIRSRFHKPFSCETRWVIRVNYSVVRRNIMMEKKIDFWRPGSRGCQNFKLPHEESRQSFYCSLCTQKNNHGLNSLNIKNIPFLAINGLRFQPRNISLESISSPRENTIGF